MAKDLLLATHPSDLYDALDSVFTSEEPWLTYEPETLIMALKGEVSDIAVDKVLAVQALAANSQSVLTHAVAFEKVVYAFNNNVCVMDEWQIPYVEEICYAVKEIEKIIYKVHGKDTKIEYSGEVPAYVASVGKHRGWVILPKSLKFAQERLNFLTGINKNSEKYKSHEQYIKTVIRLAENMDAKSAESLLHNPKIEEAINAGTEASEPLRQYIGAMVYDPTIPYR